MNFVGQVRSFLTRSRTGNSEDSSNSSPLVNDDRSISKSIFYYNIDEKTDENNENRRSILIVDQQKSDETEMTSHLNDIVNYLREHRIRFEDRRFPSNDQSLFLEENISINQLFNDRLSSSKQIQWLRPDEIVPNKWTDNNQSDWSLFRDPKPNDVIQGALGDCWFMTALSVLAEQPEYLFKVFLTKQLNNEGIYCVRLCQDGRWKSIVIDDRLPCTNKRRLAYSQAHRKQLWVPFIEKALAKLYGNYQSIIAGRCIEGLSIVSGCPCVTLVLSDFLVGDRQMFNENDLWKELIESRKNRFLMCAMCHSNQMKKNEFDQVGLTNDHAYSLQDLEELNNYRRVKLRNPWGRKSHSRFKDEQDQRELEKIDDGVFWISFELFLKFFECVDICKIRRGWFEIRSSGYFVDDQYLIDGFRLVVESSCQLDLSLFRKSSKNCRLVEQNEIRLGFALIQLDDNSLNIYRIESISMLSKMTSERFLSSTGSIKAGVYFVLPILFNPMRRNLDQKQFNLAIHSSSPIYFHRIKYNSMIEKEFLIKLTLIHGEPISMLNDSNQSIRIFELKKYWDGLIFLVENRHKRKNLHFSFRCSLSQNAHFSRMNYRFFDVIPSMHRQIIVVVSRKNVKHSFTFAHDFRYVFSTEEYHLEFDSNKILHSPTIDHDDLHLPQMILI